MIFEIIEANNELKQLGGKNIEGIKYKERISNALFENFQLNIYPNWQISRDSFLRLKSFKDDYVDNITIRGIVDRIYNLEVLRLIMNDMNLKFQQLRMELLNDNEDSTFVKIKKK